MILNPTIPGIVLRETVLSGDPLYLILILPNRSYAMPHLISFLFFFYSQHVKNGPKLQIKVETSDKYPLNSNVEHHATILYISKVSNQNAEPIKKSI